MIAKKCNLIYGKTKDKCEIDLGSKMSQQLKDRIYPALEVVPSCLHELISRECQSQPKMCMIDFLIFLDNVIWPYS